MATNLANKAMLVKLEAHGWSGTQFDRQVTKDVAARAGAAERGAGRYMKALMDKSALAGITGVIGDARNRHYELTVPWEDKGYRLLPVKLFEEEWREEND